MGLNIDFKMLPMKAHYLLYNAGTGSVVPFMPVLARQLGFSTFTVGMVYSILPILGLVAKPLFGAIADKYHKHKSMFLFFIFLTIASFASIKFIPPVPKLTQIEYHCNDGVAALKYRSENIDFCGVEEFLNANRTSIKFDLKCEVKEDWYWDYICKQWLNNTNCSREEDNLINISAMAEHVEHIPNQDCLMFEIKLSKYYSKLMQLNHDPAVNITCPKNSTSNKSIKLKCIGHANNEKLMNVISEPRVHDDQVLGYSEFWSFFVAMAISWIGMAVVVCIGDAICFDLLGKRHDLYGNQRLWGAIGWGLFSIIAGVLVDENSAFQSIKNYTVIYYMMAAALVPDMLVSSCLEFKPSTISSSIVKDVTKLFKSLRVIVFFVWCIVIGLCMALVWNFLFWHLEDLADKTPGCDHQQRIKTLQGLALGIQSFGGDLPFFFISGWFINKIGLINCMSLVLLMFGVRLNLYSFLSNPWWILPIELLQGITFALFYSTMTTYATIIAPSGTSATLQGLVGAIFEGVGVSAGSFMGGYLMNEFGGSKTFCFFGVVAIIFSVIHFIVQKILDKYVDEIVYLATDEYTTANDEMQIFDDDDDY